VLGYIPRIGRFKSEAAKLFFKGLRSAEAGGESALGASYFGPPISRDEFVELQMNRAPPVLLFAL
jgi:hypothetical protein